MKLPSSHLGLIQTMASGIRNPQAFKEGKRRKKPSVPSMGCSANSRTCSCMGQHWIQAATVIPVPSKLSCPHHPRVKAPHLEDIKRKEHRRILLY